MDLLFYDGIDWEREFAPFRTHCEECRGLCCTLLYFAKCEGFPADKSSGVPCHHQKPDGRCGIFQELASRRLYGCLAYDCFGAGQRLAARTEVITNWEAVPQPRRELLFRAFLDLAQICQSQWYLTLASLLRPARGLLPQINALRERGQKAETLSAEELACFDIIPYRKDVSHLLGQVWGQVEPLLCKPARRQPILKSYAGKKMRGKDLAGKNFSTADLSRADLRGANLYGANFLGADLRETDLRGVDLSHGLFLTQFQANSALGDADTKLPPYLLRPPFASAGAWGPPFPVKKQPRF